jgi:hypothetical protein
MDKWVADSPNMVILSGRQSCEKAASIKGECKRAFCQSQQESVKTTDADRKNKIY